MPSIISYFNPHSLEHESCTNFSYLSRRAKLTAIVLTLITLLAAHLVAKVANSRYAYLVTTPLFGLSAVAVFRRATFTLMDKYTQEEVRTFTNQETLDFRNLSEFPKKRLWADKGYVFLKDDLVAMCKAKGRAGLVNSYTQTPLPVEVTWIPEVAKALHDNQEYQREVRSKISKQTIERLVKLVEGMLNEGELMHGEGQSVEKGQRAYNLFTLYYDSIPQDERNALNSYWIDPFPVIPIAGTMRGISDFGGNSFGALIDSMNSSCMHTVAAAIAVMTIELDFKQQFELGYYGNNVIHSIRQFSRFDSKRNN